jgi:uncharacterized membrane protein YoaK (UPF0700 family)
MKIPRKAVLWLTVAAFAAAVVGALATTGLARKIWAMAAAVKCVCMLVELLANPPVGGSKRSEPAALGKSPSP